MDIKKVQVTFIDFIKKYRFVALVLALGIVLMMLPGEKKSTKPKEQANIVENTHRSISDELVKILQSIDGVGQTKVMLTVSTGEEILYQINEDFSQDENGVNKRIETVTVTDADRNQSGLVKQVNPPKYLGAIVLCQGADIATVKLSVIDAVSKITGLTSDCISVLKMK